MERQFVIPPLRSWNRSSLAPSLLPAAPQQHHGLALEFPLPHLQQKEGRLGCLSVVFLHYETKEQLKEPPELIVGDTPR